jgi:hypothetical protein
MGAMSEKAILKVILAEVLRSFNGNFFFFQKSKSS